MNETTLIQAQQVAGLVAPARVPAPRPASAPLSRHPWPYQPVAGDLVTFAARCPGCGADAVWHEQREDTRLLVSVECACG